MFATARRLREVGVVGINERNGRFIQELNPRRLYPLVDDKVRTKRLAQEAGIAAPELYGVVEIHHQVEELADWLAPYDEFVIKPAHGSGGNGILVASRAAAGRYRSASGSLFEHSELKHYVSNILSGAYSLGGQSDVAMIEYRVQFDPVFKKISFQGVPDVRIIVCRGVPVMAMVRLPTRDSGGKANLHQGAIGAGVDLASGLTLSAVWHDAIVTEHPDTEEPVQGVAIPHWNRLLELAAGCYELTGLGYLGVDLVLDRDLGPLILELNARPGLAIQIANQEGLGERLKEALAWSTEAHTVEQRVLWAQEAFAVQSMGARKIADEESTLRP